MSETTPIPWDVQNKGNIQGHSGRHEIVASVPGDRRKAQLPTVARMPDLSPRSYADAQLIIQAVNAHDDLLTALIRLREWVRNPGEDDSAENETVIDEAEAAITNYTKLLRNSPAEVAHRLRAYRREVFPGED